MSALVRRRAEIPNKPMYCWLAKVKLPVARKEGTWEAGREEGGSSPVGKSEATRDITDMLLKM